MYIHKSVNNTLVFLMKDDVLKYASLEASKLTGI